MLPLAAKAPSPVSRPSTSRMEPSKSVRAAAASFSSSARSRSAPASAFPVEKRSVRRSPARSKEMEPRIGPISDVASIWPSTRSTASISPPPGRSSAMRESSMRRRSNPTEESGRPGGGEPGAVGPGLTTRCAPCRRASMMRISPRISAGRLSSPRKRPITPLTPPVPLPPNRTWPSLRLGVGSRLMSIGPSTATSWPSAADSLSEIAPRRPSQSTKWGATAAPVRTRSSRMASPVSRSRKPFHSGRSRQQGPFARPVRARYPRIAMKSRRHARILNPRRSCRGS